MTTTLTTIVILGFVCLSLIVIIGLLLSKQRHLNSELDVAADGVLNMLDTLNRAAPGKLEKLVRDLGVRHQFAAIISKDQVLQTLHERIADLEKQTTKKETPKAVPSPTYEAAVTGSAEHDFSAKTYAPAAPLSSVPMTYTSAPIPCESNVPLDQLINDAPAATTAPTETPPA